jgi:VWFA-related protein
MDWRLRCYGAAVLALALAVPGPAQSGRGGDASRGKETLPIVVTSDGTGTQPALRKEDLDLFEGGVLQTVESLMPDDTPVYYVLLVDNSKTLKLSVEDLRAATRALVAELYEGDQMMLIAYDESPYVLQDFTTRLEDLEEAASTKYQKLGAPRLLDAILATCDDALSKLGGMKRALVLVTDGYDENSGSNLDAVVSRLQRDGVIVYVLQAPDRTRNASRLAGPKPLEVVARLTEASGGRAFPVSEAAKSAKTITEELRLNCWRATYTPRGIDPLVDRNLLVISKNAKLPPLRTRAVNAARRNPK